MLFREYLGNFYSVCDRNMGHCSSFICLVMRPQIPRKLPHPKAMSAWLDFESSWKYFLEYRWVHFQKGLTTEGRPTLMVGYTLQLTGTPDCIKKWESEQSPNIHVSPFPEWGCIAASCLQLLLLQLPHHGGLYPETWAKVKPPFLVASY